MKANGSSSDCESSSPNLANSLGDLVDAPSLYAPTAESAGDTERMRCIMDVSDLDSMVLGKMVGNYRPLRRIGKGAMGTVYRAESGDGRTVALKILHPDLMSSSVAFARFEKESNLLKRISNPAVVQLYDFGSEHGLTYMAMEHVPGVNLAQLVASHGRLRESLALEIIAHAARGLATLHDLGMVHRDIKPSNIMVVRDAIPESLFGSGPLSWPKSTLKQGIVKLTDLGLARQIEQSDSMDLTRANALLGTPQYMAPEQFTRDQEVDPAADVYALGATLYEILSGQPPLTADGLFSMADKHLHCVPPMLNTLHPKVSQAVSDVVAKTLEKDPKSRYCDARSFLADIKKLCSGSPIQLSIRCGTPPAQDEGVLSYELVCELDSPPELLWGYISNTERINRAVDLPAVHYDTETDRAGQPVRVASVRFLGMEMCWKEHPFEWIEGRKMSVLREFRRGPFKWLASVVELHPREDGKTTLIHRFHVLPKGIIGRYVADFQIAKRSREAFRRVYRRIDSVLAASLESETRVSEVGEDAFEPPYAVGASQRVKIDAMVKRLSRRDIHPDALLRLAEFVARAPDQLVGRIRPLSLAKKWGLPAHAVLSTCLHASEIGLLSHRWDIFCPACSVPSAQVSRLSDVQSMSRCPVCDMEFQTDWLHRVEMVFQVDPTLRSSDHGTYCIGGPWHLPHVVAQCRVGAKQSHELGLKLAVGKYRIGSPQLVSSLELRVTASSETFCCEVQLGQPFANQTCPALNDHHQSISFTNHFDREVVVRVERKPDYSDMLSAAKVSSLPVFRKLFPGELPNLERPTHLSDVTLLVIALAGDVVVGKDETDTAGDHSFSATLRGFKTISDTVSEHGGCVIKTIGKTLVSLFYRPDDAVQTLLNLSELGADHVDFRIVLKSGTVYLVNVDDQIEHMGDTLEQAMVQIARCGEREVWVDSSLIEVSEIERLLTTSLKRMTKLKSGPSGIAAVTRFTLRT